MRVDADKGGGGSVWDDNWRRVDEDGKEDEWDDWGELEGKTALDEYVTARRAKLKWWYPEVA
jgi:hypothetical protein